MLWGAGFLAFAALAVWGFGSMQGIGVGFLLLYILYLTYCLYYSRSRHRFRLTKGTVGPWLLGLALVAGASWHTWSDTQVDWFAAALWIGAAMALSWASLNRNERKEVLRMVLLRQKAAQL